MAGRFPDFIVIGAAKAGTTAMQAYLGQHPQVFMAKKEPRFFAYGDTAEARAHTERSGEGYFWVRTPGDYRALFAAAAPEQVCGEVSPIYLESDTAPARIRETLPAAKIIASLRNPVERAYSGYLMQVRAGREARPPEQVLRQGAHVVEASYYAARVQRYFDLFPRAQIRMYRYEDFTADNRAFMADVYGFIGVDRSFEADYGERHNVSSYPRSRLVNAVLENRFTRQVLRPYAPKWLRGTARQIKAGNLAAPPELGPEMRAALVDIYREDVQRLQELVGLDLGSWLRVG